MARASVGRPRHLRKWGWLLATGLVLAVAIAVAVFLVGRGDGPGEPPPLLPPVSGERELALRYAPIYQLRQQERACDSHGESFVPSPVELVLGQPEVSLREPGAAPVAAPGPAELEAAGPAAYLDFPGDPRRPGCRYERDARRLGEGLPPTVYARVVAEEGRPGIAIQYWSFYYFNDWNNKHEGDWEMVQVVFDASTVDEAAASGPAYVVYAQHGGGERADWDASKLRKVGSRPVVFVSAGSHASYFAPLTYLGLGEAGTGFGCDVALPPYTALDPSVVVLQDEAAGASAPYAWLAFDGRWGQVLGGEFSGPTGPQTKRSWKEPLTWAEDARDGSATLPGSDFLGVDAVHSFCGAVEAGSQLLRAYMQYPMLIGGSVVLLLGIVSVSGLVVLRDAARGPLVGQSTAGFLRHRRTLGQMIRAAVIVYGRSFRLFLGIAIAFIPLDICLALLQGWLLTIPPFDRISWLLNANEVSHLLVGLLVGGMASFAVYLCLVSTAIAAVRALDEGEPVDVRSAYRRALRRAPAIVLGRGRTLVVLALLGFSVVGLPIAAWLAVRWYFVESAVLLDGESQWTAPGASSRAVDGQWFRALRLVLFFGIFGAVAGPLLAFALLLGTGIHPALVNVVAGLFHTAALPFTAIGLSMAFCDLQARASERGPLPSRRGRTGVIATVWRGLAASLHLFEGRRRR